MCCAPSISFSLFLCYMLLSLCRSACLSICLYLFLSLSLSLSVSFSLSLFLSSTKIWDSSLFKETSYISQSECIYVLSPSIWFCLCLFVSLSPLFLLSLSDYVALCHSHSLFSLSLSLSLFLSLFLSLLSFSNFLAKSVIFLYFWTLHKSGRCNADMYSSHLFLSIFMLYATISLSVYLTVYLSVSFSLSFSLSLSFTLCLSLSRVNNFLPKSWILP